LKADFAHKKKACKWVLRGYFQQRLLDLSGFTTANRPTCP
jgi:hypothetical protein